MPRWKLLGVLLAALVVLALGCQGASLPARPAAAPPEPAAAQEKDAVVEAAAAERPSWSDEASPVPVSSRDPVWGDRDAPVTLVVFADFQCPYCARAARTLAQLRQTYGPRKLRVVWKHQPLSFHLKAKPAAEAAHAVFERGGNDAFWAFHDRAFANQGDLSAERFVEWAGMAGIGDAWGLMEDLATHRWAEKVEGDMAVAKQLGVTGTPAFFVNGVFLSGAQPFDRFRSVIDAELPKAQALVEGGMPRDRVYVTLSRLNKRDTPPAADEDEAPEDTVTVWKVPVGTSPVLGDPNALVTIVEFADFQCPFCQRVEETLRQVRSTYGDKVRLVWKNEPLPFHPRAEPAAQLALEARAQKRSDQAFWLAHDKLLENQKALEDADLATYAAQLGLDVAKVKAAIARHTHKTQIDDDQEVAEDFAANGTPHFFINGRRLVGAQPFEKFQRIIDEEIVRARRLVGTAPPGKLYEALIKDGRGAAEPERKVVAVPAGAPAKGNLGEKVTMQVFSDYQCPYCGRAEATIAQVMKDYGARVRLVWRDLPLPMHPDAPLAAEAAREVLRQRGSEAFWKMHDLMFANQKELGRSTLDGYAATLGLDLRQWHAALDRRAHKAVVDADQKAAEDAGISGTPAFVINGYFISGAQPYGKFRKLIERALAEAK